MKYRWSTAIALWVLTITLYLYAFHASYGWARVYAGVWIVLGFLYLMHSWKQFQLSRKNKASD